MQRGMQSGLLLPQVAMDWNWNREELLAQTCHKAGMVADAWKDPETNISGLKLKSSDVLRAF